MKEVVFGRYEIENRKIPSNIWLGVSVEDHKSAQERIPYLLGTPADKRFVSVEPMLSFINLTKLSIKIYTFLNSLKGFYHGELLPGMNNFISKLDWVIAGGESGPHARPMHPDWVRSIRDQCGQTGTPFFFKQWGAWMPESQITRDIKSYKINMMGKEIMHRVGKKAAGKVLDGVEHVEFPKIEAYAQ
jgi:protein gp37